MTADQLEQIGQVLKSNGTDGQVVIGLRGISPDDISEKEPVYVIFDGLPVPYFFESLSQRGSNKLLANLTDVRNLEDAEELVGKAVYLPADDEDADGYEDFEGWTLLNQMPDGSIAEVGVISGFEDIPGNPCLEVGDNLVPLHEDLVLEVNPDTQTVLMQLPEGLIN